VSGTVGILTYRFAEVKKASYMGEMPAVYRVSYKHSLQACAILSRP